MPSDKEWVVAMWKFDDAARQQVCTYTNDADDAADDAKGIKICGHVNSQYRHLGNAKQHLARHKIFDEGHAVPMKRRGHQKLQQQKLQVNGQGKTERDLMFAICEGHVAFEAVEGPFFRAAFAPYFTNANTISGKMPAFGAEVLGEELAKRRDLSATLAVDSGTVWERYFAIVACVPGFPPLVVRCVSDGELPNGQQTIVNLSAAVGELVEQLRAKGVHVVACVADNASNMQCISVPDCPVIRCIAHSLQLIIKDVQPLFQSTLDAIEALRPNFTAMPPRQMTRWS